MEIRGIQKWKGGMASLIDNVSKINKFKERFFMIKKLNENSKINIEDEKIWIKK